MSNQTEHSTEIIIDEEFKRILPKLDEQTFAWLEENILEYGCREPLVLWNDILIDGHNRYSILKKHDLPVNTINMEFNSREEVLIWIISTQVSRRNLSPLQLSYFRGLHYNTEKQIIRNVTGSNQYSEVNAQNEHKPQEHDYQGRTAGRLAEQYNVSPITIRRDAQVANGINAIGDTSPEAKIDILSGKTQISRRQLQELSSGNKKSVSDVVTKIIDGTIERRRSVATDSDEPQSWELQFNKMTSEFRQVLRSHAKTDDTDSMRSALRQYIEMLENLYENI